ncbi:hypothetical protein JHK86_000839 [Glycine max]|nr:hypothetical protein JHK86_000839 [Glycine max]
MNQRSPLDVNVAYVEGRDEADKGTSNTQDFFTRPSGKRTRNDLTSQYNAGGYIPQQDGAGQDGAGDAAHGVFEIEDFGGCFDSMLIYNTLVELCSTQMTRTDSHTTMIDGLGIAGWGVGEIEAKVTMLGQVVITKNTIFLLGSINGHAVTLLVKWVERVYLILEYAPKGDVYKELQKCKYFIKKACCIQCHKKTDVNLGSSYCTPARLTLVRVRVTLSCEWQTIGKYEVALISVDFAIEWVFEVENMKLYTLQSHTSSSLHFSNSDHAIGVGLIAFSVEMTNKAKGKGKEVAGKGFAGKRKGAFDDDKTDGGRKRNK